MVDILKLMEKELSTEPNAKELISLSKEIFQWYQEGGPSRIEENLLQNLEDADSTVSKNIRGISPEIKVPKKKAKKRRK